MLPLTTKQTHHSKTSLTQQNLRVLVVGAVTMETKLVGNRPTRSLNRPRAHPSSTSSNTSIMSSSCIVSSSSCCATYEKRTHARRFELLLGLGAAKTVKRIVCCQMVTLMCSCYFLTKCDVGAHAHIGSKPHTHVFWVHSNA